MATSPRHAVSLVSDFDPQFDEGPGDAQWDTGCGVTVLGAFIVWTLLETAGTEFERTRRLS